MLAANNIAHIINQHLLFKGINFELKPGQMLQLLGGNGSGKTTLLKILAGLIKPAFGEVSWQQCAIDEAGQSYSEQLFYLGHKKGIKPTLTVAENIRYYQTLLSNQSHISINDLMNKVGLVNQANQTAQTLSAGQQQRLAMTRFFCGNRTLWLMDEPLTAIDVDGKSWLEQVMIEHLNQGGIIVVSSHVPFDLPQCQTLHMSDTMVEVVQ